MINIGKKFFVCMYVYDYEAIPGLKRPPFQQ